MAEARRIRTAPPLTGTTAQAVGRSSARARSSAALGAGLNRAAERASALTDYNAHSQALRVFTRHFGFTDLTNELDGIIREQERAGQLTGQLYERRTRVYNELMQRVRNEYGEAVLRRIHRAL